MVGTISLVKPNGDNQGRFEYIQKPKTRVINKKSEN